MKTNGQIFTAALARTFSAQPRVGAATRALVARP